jgi:transposase-like protein
MIRGPGKLRRISPAQRGIIVQRVLVDGWSLAEAAAAFGIAERRIAGWVAAYRRHGMASLREDAAIERPSRRWLWRLRITSARLAATLRGRLGGNPARAVRLLRRDGKNPELPPGDDRRSRRR